MIRLGNRKRVNDCAMEVRPYELSTSEVVCTWCNMLRAKYMIRWLGRNPYTTTANQDGVRTASYTIHFSIILRGV